MQRWCNKLRSLTTTTTRILVHQPSHETTPLYKLNHSRLLHSQQIPPRSNSIIIITPLFFNRSVNNNNNRGGLLNPTTHPVVSPHPASFIQLRYLTKKEMKEKMLKYKPRTPITSKLKKYKIKCYSSFKGRFKLLKDGQIRRWKEGKRHNAHLKSKAAKRRGRRPGLVPPAYAKVMKKLNFCG